MQFSRLCCGLGKFLRRLVWIAMPAWVSLSTKVKICQTIHKYENLGYIVKKSGDFDKSTFLLRSVDFL